ncbi:MAG: 4a-hydroxytetrahydrobiopterin dehydratase [Candidatus Woesearchaeota archaeon]|jgi:4a-hydroxytetrahydrobiopterin dehydratase
MKYPKLWKKEENILTRIFIFNNFIESVKFVDKLVPLAENLNHHPDIEIFSYKYVKVKLSTHKTGNITKKDIELAGKINNIT